MTTESLTAQVMARSHHLHDYLDLLHNADPAIRVTALEMALKDSDPAVHAVALSAFLKRFNALTPIVQLKEGSPISPEDVPRLAMHDLKWSDDGMSFLGYYSTTCSGGVYVRGQIAGNTLAINYDGVCLRPVLLGIDPGDGAKASEAKLTACQIILEPNSQNNSLDGPLQCIGVAARLPARLPFGN